MSDKIKKKVENAIKAAEYKKIDQSSLTKCPLRCWDIFAMNKGNYSHLEKRKKRRK